jgi:hypothetical protein
MADTKDPGGAVGPGSAHAGVAPHAPDKAADKVAPSQADAAKTKRSEHWQKLANHTQEQINKMNEILNDPYASAADKVEAQETVDAMTKIQFRLKNQYNVAPNV